MNRKRGLLQPYLKFNQKLNHQHKSLKQLMKLADILSDKSWKALNDVRKSCPKEVIDKIDENRNSEKQTDYDPSANCDVEHSKEIGKEKKDRRIVWRANKKKKAELRQRLREKEKAYRLAIETEMVKQALGKNTYIGKKEFRKEENTKEQNRIKVERGNNIYPTSTSNSLKAWSIPMGGQNKRY
jgi:hypothetical protein